MLTASFPSKILRCIARESDRIGQEKGDLKFRRLGKNEEHEIQFLCVAIAIFPILSIQGELRPVALI